MQLNITSNVGLVRQGMQDLESEPIKIGRRRIYDAMNRITREMEGYPGERPQQKYRRTGRLGASWRVGKLSDGYQITNDARGPGGRRYARFVVGDARGIGQAWMHQARWPLFRNVVDAEIEKLPQEVAQEIEMVARQKLARAGGAI